MQTVAVHAARASYATVHMTGSPNLRYRTSAWRKHRSKHIAANLPEEILFLRSSIRLCYT